LMTAPGGNAAWPRSKAGVDNAIGGVFDPRLAWHA
jgi:hypothetical protein